jgi:sorting nexin-29
VDQIFTLRQILEKCKELNIATHHLFIDYKAAYDSINRNELYKTVETLNMPSKLITLVKLTMKDTQNCVRIQSDLSESIYTGKWLHQGDALACLLFNIALEKVIRDFKIETTKIKCYKSMQMLTISS